MPRLTRPAPSQWRSLWSIDPDIVFLNHGSFGACPIAVLEHQQRLRQRLERDPMRFFVQDYEGLLDAARAELAAFVGAEPANLAFVPNATAGVNAVLRSLKLQPGNQLLTTNHEYNASRNALEFVAGRAGAEVVVANVPFPIAAADQVVEAVLAKVTPQTRLLLIDHVTSQTGLVMPIAPLIRQLAAQGIDTLVDGAHAPGMLPLNLAELGAAYYAGNCHKWMCAPKGAAFLYVHRHPPAVRPIAISHGANAARTDRSRFHLEFDWTGTSDPTPYLCVPAAIRELGGLLPGGWAELMRRNRELAVEARSLLCDRLGVSPPCPADMLGAMAVLPLANGSWQALYQALFEQFGIQAQIMPWQNPGDRLLRVSAQLYNTLAEYEYLASALRICLQTER